MNASVFIDGDQGTTGLKIVERLSGRQDIDLVTLPDDVRKNAAARAQAINDCDVAVLCLPDAAARQAVASIRNPRVRVIDASSAHRTDADWVYGFPEMSAQQPDRIAQALRVSNPGCYPTGAIALLRPLVEAECLRNDVPLSIHAVSGYSGRGREGMTAHEGPGAATALAFQTYGLDLQHKHVPEMRLHSGLLGRPFFVPSYGNFRQGIALTIALHASMLHRPMTAQALRDVLAQRYRDQRHVRVLDAAQTDAMTGLNPQALNGSNDLQLAVFGSDEHDQILLSAVFDNLGKGASGAAVQNLELMLGLRACVGDQGDHAQSGVGASRPARAALMDITARPDQVFLRGEGSWLWDDRGRRYLDFVQGWAVNTLGHAPACIREALAQQSGLLLTPSPAFHNAPAIALADLLCRHSVFDQVFFTNSGAEANEGAIKLARKWGQLHRGGAHEIITFGDAFHGRSLATMSASGKPGWDRLFAPQVPGFPKAVLNDLASVQALIGDGTVAIMLEPVQGESGVFPATPAFLHGLRALCDTHGLLLIFDEVQTGVGRLGRLFGYQHFGVAPDIMTLAKGLGGGVPIGALLARQPACVFAHGDQGGTFNGNPLVCAVGLAVMQTVSADGFLDQVRRTGDYLGNRLEALSARYGLGGTRGAGLLRALDLGQPLAAGVVTHAREQLMLGGAGDNTGLLLNAPRPSVLRFMPALNVTLAEVDGMIDGLSASLDALGMGRAA